MSAQYYQNQIPIPAVQNNLPVQTVQSFAPVQQISPCVQPQCQQVQNNNQYIQNYPANNYPRYAPMIHQGQLYSVPVPEQPSTKAGNVGTVNISINGVNPPSVGQAAPQMPQYYPAYVPYPYYAPQVAANPIKQEAKNETDYLAATKIDRNTKEEKTVVEEKKQVENKTEPEKAKKHVVELTDDYIRQLESNLTDKDKNVRHHAIAELLNRFKEDESRKDDIRLINLLNLSLQDNSEPLIYTAMQALDNGYTNGNELTVKRLEAIKLKHDDLGNSDTAESILTKLAQRNFADNNSNAVVPIKENSQISNNPTGQKLNLLAE